MKYVFIMVLLNIIGLSSLSSCSWPLTKTGFTYLLVGQHRDDFEHKLIHDLFTTGYSKEALPVINKSEAIEIMFDMAYSQLIYLVRKLRLGGCIVRR